MYYRFQILGWIVVTFDTFHKISALQLQGNMEAAQWVVTFNLLYKDEDGVMQNATKDGNQVLHMFCN